ncbi:MAG: transporter substrate-binding domain-containing protein [Alphaproteobacteria bacterium]
MRKNIIKNYKLVCKVSVFLLVLCLAGCAAKSQVVYEKAVKPLRIGISTGYPPVAFKEKIGGNPVGVEVDFAKKLSGKFNRPVQFVELKFEQLIPALLKKEIDIIMSGMTITKARKVRINFTEPYLTNGLMTLMRDETIKEYNTPEKLYRTTGTIGFQKDTTGDIFVRRKCPYANKASYLYKSDAVAALKNGVINFVVTDAPAVGWYVSENETELTALFVPLTEEYLAWGVRYDDKTLLKSLNLILNEWRKNGTIKTVLKRWLPYYK